jgi:hypothetical protein
MIRNGARVVYARARTPDAKIASSRDASVKRQTKANIARFPGAMGNLGKNASVAQRRPIP